MNVLGISCYYHDSAACLLQDGGVVVAAQEERFSRIKHDPSFPEKAIAFCLKQSGISCEELDYVVFYEKPFIKFDRIIRSILSTYPRSYHFFREAVHSYVGQKFWIKSQIANHLKVDPRKILFIDHHLSHAASSFFASPFEEAAILTVDGVGEWATATIGYGKASWKAGLRNERNEIRIIREMRFPHSLGLLYSAFTAFLGFEVNEGEYKVMGMAPYGEPKYLDKIYKLAPLALDGSIALNLEYFAFHYHPEKMFSDSFVRLFGPPRDPQSRFVTANTPLYDDDPKPTREEMELNQYYADVAASVQAFMEETLLTMAKELFRLTGQKNLCIAGGVALNSVANYRILRETPFEHLYIPPAAGDAGGAVGAALYVYHALLNMPRKYVMEHGLLGKEYSEGEIGDFLRNNGIPYRHFPDDESLLQFTASALVEGKVIGWFQGRFEWGPRALGCRSILADPRNPRMKDIMNVKIKFREPFRPFAPSVLSEEAPAYFDIGGYGDEYPFRYMLFVAPVKRPTLIPAVTHVDGTGRLQTVIEEYSPLYYHLISTFMELTGIPVLLNTSFNLKGEPIVNSPADAFNTFQNSGMDILILGHYVVEKSA